MVVLRDTLVQARDFAQQIADDRVGPAWQILQVKVGLAAHRGGFERQAVARGSSSTSGFTRSSMNPYPLVVSGQDSFLQGLVASVASVECAAYFTNSPWHYAARAKGHRVTLSGNTP
jgi:hypothetical protein